MKKEELLSKLHKNNKTKIKKKYRCLQNDKLKIIGITGSHGKSTVAYLLNEYLKKLGYKTVLYSSIMIDSETSIYINNTSTEVPLSNEVMLFHALEEAINTYSDYLILEVNDSTINKGICDDLDFDIKVLTNIEPLENQMFENYVELKKQFITNGNHKTIIGLVSDITIDLYHDIMNKDVVTYTTEYFLENKNIKENDVTFYLRPSNNKYHSFSGLEFEVVNQNDKYKVKTNLNMPFHGLNILCLITIIQTLNLFDKKEFNEFIKNINIPGRDEVIKYKNGYVMISSGSIPQLEVLAEYRNKNEISKITLITGSTGNLFPTWNKEYTSQKYIEQMDYDMKFAYNYAIKYVDEIVITANDPGNNDLKELLTKQENLVKGKTQYKVIESRIDAIHYALDNIKSKEVVFISGRGNREIMCENNSIIKHLDKNVVINYSNRGN